MCTLFTLYSDNLAKLYTICVNLQYLIHWTLWHLFDSSQSSLTNRQHKNQPWIMMLLVASSECQWSFQLCCFIVSWKNRKKSQKKQQTNKKNTLGIFSSFSCSRQSETCSVTSFVPGTTGWDDGSELRNDESRWWASRASSGGRFASWLWVSCPLFEHALQFLFVL